MKRRCARNTIPECSWLRALRCWGLLFQALNALLPPTQPCGVLPIEKLPDAPLGKGLLKDQINYRLNGCDITVGFLIPQNETADPISEATPVSNQ